MRPLRVLMSLADAQKLIAQNIRPIARTETLEIEDCLGRVLATDVNAGFDVPGFDRAAMDGYAVLANDTTGATDFAPKTLKRIAVIEAGAETTAGIGPGECTQIATGARLPQGADAVVMVENTEIEGDTVDVFKPVYPRANVSSRGEDIKGRERVLRRGALLNPSRIGTLAALGMNKAKVYEKPRIAVIPTGREIAELNEPLAPTQVYDINSYTLISLLKENGCVARKHGIVVDEFEPIKDAVRTASSNDMVVVSGGSSVGERDVLYDVIKELGRVLFHGVQIKPGKPTLFGLIEGKPVFGMPGYPTSCLVNAYVFLKPSVRRIARLKPEPARLVRKKLSKRVVSALGRRQFLTVKIEKGDAVPVFKESGAITSMANADGYIEIPENVDLLEKGEEVAVRLF